MKLMTVIGRTLFAFALTAANAQAAVLTQTFMNDFETNSIYLWADDATNLQFDRTDFARGMSGWAVQSNTGETLILGGPTVAAAQGRFTLQLDYGTRPFSMQWAEVFFESGINRILGGGTLTYTERGWTGSDVFTRGHEVPHQFVAQAVVPLPHSILLLLSALALLPSRRLLRVRALT